MDFQSCLKKMAMPVTFNCTPFFPIFHPKKHSQSHLFSKLKKVSPPSPPPTKESPPFKNKNVPPSMDAAARAKNYLQHFPYHTVFPAGTATSYHCPFFLGSCSLRVSRNPKQQHLPQKEEEKRTPTDSRRRTNDASRSRWPC